MKFNTQKAALAGAIFAALIRLFLSICDALGIYKGAVNMIQEVQMFYDPTVVGTITGMIEAGVITYLSILTIVWIYGALEGSGK